MWMHTVCKAREENTTSLQYVVPHTILHGVSLTVETVLQTLSICVRIRMYYFNLVNCFGSQYKNVVLRVLCSWRYWSILLFFITFCFLLSKHRDRFFFFFGSKLFEFLVAIITCFGSDNCAYFPLFYFIFSKVFSNVFREASSPSNVTRKSEVEIANQSQTTLTE